MRLPGHSTWRIRDALYVLEFVPFSGPRTRRQSADDHFCRKGNEQQRGGDRRGRVRADWRGGKRESPRHHGAVSGPHGLERSAGATAIQRWALAASGPTSKYFATNSEPRDPLKVSGGP